MTGPFWHPPPSHLRKNVRLEPNLGLNYRDYDGVQVVKVSRSVVGTSALVRKFQLSTAGGTWFDCLGVC